MFQKEKFLPFILFMLLVTSITGKGQGCVWDIGSDAHFETSHELRFFSDLMSVLGEGLVKAPLKTDHLQHADFLPLDPFSKVGSSQLYTYYFLSDKPLWSFLYEPLSAIPSSASIFVFVRSLLI